MKFSVLFPIWIATSACLLAQTSAVPSTAAPKPPPAGTRAKPAAGVPVRKPAVTGSAAAKPVEGGKIVLTVGDQKITEKEFDLLIDALPEQYRAQARGPMKRQMAEQIARVKLLSAEARKRGLDKEPATVSRIRFQEDNLLAGAIYNDMVQKVIVDDAMVAKYFDEHKAEFESVAARHILVRFKGSQVPNREGKPELSEEQALARATELKKQLDGGADFAALAKTESDDAGSGANGGELGTFTHGQMVPAFDEVAFKLPVGQVSEPVKTQFGYHLIRTDKHETKTLDQVKTDISGRLKPEAAKKAVEDLSKSGTIKLDDAYFGPEQPATPPPGARGGVSATPVSPDPAPVK